MEVTNYLLTGMVLQVRYIQGEGTENHPMKSTSIWMHGTKEGNGALAARIPTSHPDVS